MRARVALVALWAAACVDPAPPRPHVVIVLVDQLRADAAQRWMPRVGALGERGVVFENARSAAGWTYPSVVSLMSGLYPPQHGATGHRSRNWLSRFDPAVPLLGRRLRQAGYRTAAFVANPFFHRWNPFYEGFDHYDVSFVGNAGHLRAGARVWSRAGMFADSVNAAVFEHYATPPEPGVPEFSYVHYIDVHGPWAEAPFGPAPAAAAGEGAPAWLGHYRAAAGHADERTAELYEFFRARSGGDLLFVFTSDHGRSLPGELEAGDGPELRRNKLSMHDFNLRVPLAILPSSQVERPRRIEAPVSLVDVTPTLLDWLGLEPEVPLAGRSLLPLIRGEAGELSERPLYAANDAFGLWTDALLWRGRKYVRYFDLESGRLTTTRRFDLGEDPDELRGSTDPLGAAAPILEEIAEAALPRYEASFVAPGAGVKEALQALGYLEEETP